MKRTALDRAALATIAILLAVLAVVIARGDQVGVQISTPALSSGQKVSIRPRLALAFSEAMNAAEVETRLSIQPPISATLRWAGRTLFVDALAPLAANTAYTLSIQPGATSQRGRVLLKEYALTFHTRDPQVVYMAPASGVPNLFAAQPDGAAARLITSEARGVFDFAISPDGEKIAYSATRNDKGARDIWLINADGGGRERAANCETMACQYVTWSADGSRLAFERRTMITGAVGATPGAARVWLYDIASRDLAPLSADSQRIGALPRFAPMGDALAYYDPSNSVISIIDTRSGQEQSIPSLLGDPGEWSPDGKELIFPDLQTSQSGEFSQLFKANVADGALAPFSAASAANDISARWSPLGNEVAFARQNRAAPAPSGSFGPIAPQVWVAQADGTRARQLTAESEYSFGGLAWSADGRWLAATRVNLLIPNSKPEVWLVKADGSETRRLAQDATLPAWLP